MIFSANPRERLTSPFCPKEFKVFFANSHIDSRITCIINLSNNYLVILNTNN